MRTRLGRPDKVRASTLQSRGCAVAAKRLCSCSPLLCSSAGAAAQPARRPPVRLFAVAMPASSSASVINHQRRLICAVMLPAIALGHALGYSLDLLPAAALPILFTTVLPARKLFSTWPNCVTIIRTLLAILNALWPTGSPTLRCGCGIAFVALDFVDGALARRLKQATPLGGLLDEEADAFGTLVASTELVRLSLAPRWLAMHQGAAHYLFIIVEWLLCPGFEWHMPFARTAAGVMGVCLFSACVAAAAGAHTAATALGTVGCAVNAGQG